MAQEVITLKLKDLILWSENPRDPINAGASNQDIVDRALGEHNSKWIIQKLANEMGAYFDFSELPTVVYHKNKPVVYDGNRRVIIGKLKHGYVVNENIDTDKLPDFPLEIPCNVCSEGVALNNVFRKHAESGSWKPLERDIFLHKHMKKEKSIFLLLEENTGLISSNPSLNQRFVKEEVLKEAALKEMGFEFQENKFVSKHTNNDSKLILDDVVNKVVNKKISTRGENRGKVLPTLNLETRRLIESDKKNKFNPISVNFISSDDSASTGKQKVTRRTAKKEDVIFGEKLSLVSGNVGNLYRDITDLYNYYVANKHSLSASFPGLIRMSLRLLCETAADSQNMNMDNYLSKYFTDAKKIQSQHTKTFLSTQHVTETSIMQLLHTGTHTYKPNVDQTMAISIILGAILKITHGKS